MTNEKLLNIINNNNDQMQKRLISLEKAVLDLNLKLESVIKWVEHGCVLTEKDNRN